jgi:hypothetical protein
MPTAVLAALAVLAEPGQVVMAVLAEITLELDTARGVAAPEAILVLAALAELTLVVQAVREGEQVVVAALLVQLAMLA